MHFIQAHVSDILIHFCSAFAFTVAAVTLFKRDLSVLFLLISRDEESFMIAQNRSRVCVCTAFVNRKEWLNG